MELNMKVVNWFALALFIPSLVWQGQVLAAPTVQTVAIAATVNINTATAAELAQALTGVGVKRAEQIVALREQIGKFTAVEQLLEVKGIGPRFLEKNASKLTL